MVDAIAVGAIVLVNAAVGFFQEYRAERAVLALRAMTAPRARVLRALFEIGPLPLRDCLLGIVLGLVPVTVLELKKLLQRGPRSVCDRASHKNV